MKLSKIIFLLLMIIAPFFQGLYFMYQIFFCGVFMGMLLLILVMSDIPIKVPKNYMMGCLSVIAVGYFSVMIYAVDKGMATFGGFRFLVYLLFLVIYSSLYSNEFKELSLKAITISYFMMSIFAFLALFSESIYNHVFIHGRFGGFIQYANTYGVLGIVILFIICRIERYRIYDYLMFAVIVASILLTYSRSIMLLLVGSILLMVWFKKKASIGLVFSAVIGALMAYGMTVLLKLSDVSNRLTQMTTNASEWRARLIYYSDAIEIIKDHPFGIGYLSYPYIQKYYRTGLTYFTKFVHNSIMQFILDIGIVGGIIFVLLFILIAFDKKIDKMLKISVGIICVHSLIDFDFQFPIVFFMIIILTYHEVDSIAIKKRIMIGVGGVVIGLYSVLALGTHYYNQERYEAAYSLLPFYTQSKIDWLRENEADVYSIQMCEKIIDDNSYIVYNYSYMRDYYWQKNDYKTALIYSKKMVEYNPISLNALENYCENLLMLGQDLIDKGDFDKGKIYLEEIIKMPIYIEKLANSRDTDYNVKHKVTFEMTKELMEYYNEALSLVNGLKR